MSGLIEGTLSWEATVELFMGWLGETMIINVCLSGYGSIAYLLGQLERQEGPLESGSDDLALDAVFSLADDRPEAERVMGIVLKRDGFVAAGRNLEVDPPQLIIELAGEIILMVEGPCS